MTERVKYGGELPGDPIYYNPDHRPFVPVVGGAAPFCSCGWRSAVFPKPGEFMADHLRKHDE